MRYSILKFGSNTRGDSDNYSDKDILIVSDNLNDLNQLNQYYSKLGWSVSSYTYSKLEYLSKKGYLFIKHLIDEGVIEHDYNNRLQDILDNFKEIKNYDKEIETSQNFIDFIKFIPDNRIGYLWLCDNIYIALRNCLIYESAVDRTFIFSYPLQINKLLESKCINQFEVKMLVDLRILKTSYRNGHYEIFPSKDYIIKIIELAKKIGLKLNILFTEKDFNISLDILNKIKNPYKKLRVIELYLKNKGIEDDFLNKCIKNPQMYANHKFIENITERTIQKISSQLLHKEFEIK